MQYQSQANAYFNSLVVANGTGEVLGYTIYCPGYSGSWASLRHQTISDVGIITKETRQIEAKNLNEWAKNNPSVKAWVDQNPQALQDTYS